MNVHVFLLVCLLIVSLMLLCALCWPHHVEFTRLYADPYYSGSPITCAEATGLRERSRRGRRKLRMDQSDINTGQTVRSRGRGFRTFVLLILEQLYK
jgi:hypothetical protein